MIKSYFSAWERSFNFSAKTSRREFWNFCIIDYILLAILTIPQSFLGRSFVRRSVSTVTYSSTDTHFILLLLFLFAALQIIYLFGGIFPRISIRIRRLRDIGKSWQNIFWWFIPIVGLVLEFGWLTRLQEEKEQS